jgi:hypothetical protein
MKRTGKEDLIEKPGLLSEEEKKILCQIYSIRKTKIKLISAHYDELHQCDRPHNTHPPQINS